MKTRFYYSRAKFWVSLIVAIFLTAMVSGLSWMIMDLMGNPNAKAIAVLTAIVFLGFFSVRMAFQYWKNEVVVAVLPTGIQDVRWGTGPIEWERIKYISLRQREDSFQMYLYLWPQETGEREYTIETEPLESSIDKLVAAISVHHPVRREI